MHTHRGCAYAPCWHEAAAVPASAPAILGPPSASLTPGSSVCVKIHNEVFRLLQDTHTTSQRQQEPDVKLTLTSSAHAMGSSLFLFFLTLYPSPLPDSTWTVDLRFQHQM